jgi:Tol biopolymer transport system component
VPVLYTPVSQDGGTETIEGEWTEDGQYFIFYRTWKEGINTYSQLLSVDRNGKNLQALIRAFNDDKWITSLKISPDQKTVVFSISQLSDLHKSFIGIFDRRSGQINIFEESALIMSQVNYGTFVWSPDSKWVAYLYSIHLNQNDINITNIDSGETFCITNNDSLEKLMDWK